MDTIQELSVKVALPDGRSSLGQVKVQHWDQAARLRRALVTLAKCWGAALLAVAIPLAHFVLVPGLFLAGIILALRAHGTESMVLGGEAVCPNCGEALPIVKQADAWPLTDLCAKCQKSVSVTKS